MYTYDESNKWPGLDDVSPENGDVSIWRIWRRMAAVFKKKRKENKGEEDDKQ